jgi:hypothetical protein
MASYITPWRCKECNNSWFRKEEYVRIVRKTYPPGTDAIGYAEPGEESYRKVYTCCSCGRELEELYE